MFCTQCGTQISEDAVYCDNCGAKVRKAETLAYPSPDNTMEQKEACDHGTGNQKSSTFWTWVAGLIILVVMGFAIRLLFLFSRWVFSSLIRAVVVIAGGYILYYIIAEIKTEYSYGKKPKELQLPKGMTAAGLLETLSGRFNYPYFKGVHYGVEGECVIEGKYSMYPVIFGENCMAEISYAADENDKRRHTVMLEAMAIRDYINKFFNPDLPVNVLRDMKRLKFAEGRRKVAAFVCWAASLFIVVAIVCYLAHFVPLGSLQSMTTPGIEVRSAYLSQYSTQVTIEEAFENFFDKCKWEKYDSEGYTNVAFTGVCEYAGQRADVRIIFKITGENFIVDRLDINGRTQSDLILYGLLSVVYENY